MADRYYGIQFKCKTAQHGDQIRFISYGLIKDGELTEADIAQAKSELVRMTTYDGQGNLMPSSHRIEILDFNRSEEHTRAEWDQLINQSNDHTK